MTERYGSDVQLLVGSMANLSANPANWYSLEFMNAIMTPVRERKERPKLGAARTNELDPIKPRDGFLKGNGSVVLDADARQLPLWLRIFLGPPATETGPTSGLYTHTWNTGLPAQYYGAIQAIAAGSQVRQFFGVAMESLSVNVTGEQANDIDISIALRWMSRARGSALSGTTVAYPTPSPMSRALLALGGAAAAQCKSASWAWNRKLEEDAFLSTTATLSALRPGIETGLTGSAHFLDDGETFDTDEETDAVIQPTVKLLGSVAGHEIDLAFNSALLQGIPIEIKGPDVIERDISFVGFQTSSLPGGTITITNDVPTYASI